jgi:transposase
MFREVSTVEIKEVLRQRQQGRFLREIARAVGLDRKTVRRYLEVACANGFDPDEHGISDELVNAVAGQLRPGRPGGAGRGDSWHELEGEHAFVRESLNAGLRITKIRTLLSRRGVEVPYRTLHRYCASAFPGQLGGQRETVRVADGEPGKELQADFGRLGKVGPVGGRWRLVKGLILTACVSRHQFCWPTYGESLPEVIEGFEEGWDFFGGVFAVVITDNLKAVVDRADPLNPRINPAFLEYAQARGFVVDPCVAGSPTQKPRVERAVPYCRQSGFAGEEFGDLLAAREGMRRWCLEEAGRRVHGTTYQRPLEHFLKEEKERLLAAPTERYDTPVYARPKVARDHHVEVAKALYSVPGNRIGQHVDVRADSRLVRISQHGCLVREHPRKAPGGRSTLAEDLPEHKRAYALRDIEYLKQQAAGHGEHIGAYAASLLDDPLPWTRMRKVYRLLSLVKRFGAGRVEEACARTLAFEVVDVVRVQRMLERALEHRPDEPVTQLRFAPILRPRFARDPSAFMVGKEGDHE